MIRIGPVSFLFKLTVKHSTGCRALDPWGWFLTGERASGYDAIGRKVGGHGRNWRELVCNDPNCVGRAIVNLDSLMLAIPMEEGGAQ